MADEPDFIGEVIEASTAEFAAESRELHSPPAFGSFVKVLWSGGESAPLPNASTGSGAVPLEDDDPFMQPFRQKEGSFGPEYRGSVEGESAEPVARLVPAIYGIVHQALTGSRDSNRRLRAYWKGEERLKEEQPELSEWLLVTEFRAVVIGYAAGGLVRRILPPRPPKIYSFVYPCTPDEIRLISSKMDFLRTLANFSSAPSEEVVAACVREADAARGGDFEFLVAAGKELATLFREDYDRLQAIMRRVAP